MVFDLENVDKEIANFYKGLGKEKLASVFGAVLPLRIALASRVPGKILYITSDYSTAQKCHEMFSSLLPSVLIKPAADNLVYSKVRSHETAISNSVALGKLASGQAQVVVCPVEAAMSFYPRPEDVKAATITLRAGSTIDPLELASRLAKGGYRRESLVSEMGQFSLRGDILDVFPIGANIAYRVDFFDNDIEDISEIDPSSYKKGKKAKKITIYPCKNAFISQSEAEKLVETLQKMQNREFADQTSREEFVSSTNDVIFKLENQTGLYDLDYLMPLIKSKASLLDYGPFCTVIDECKMVYDRAASYQSEIEERIKALEKSGGLLAKTGNFLRLEELRQEICKNTAITFQKLTNNNRFYDAKLLLNLKSNPLQRYTHSIKDLAKDLKTYDYNGYRNILLAKNKENAQRIKASLASCGVEYDVLDASSVLSVCDDGILPCEFAAGFVLVKEKIAVFGTYDILPREMQKSTLKVARQNVFSVPKVGDYVVHSFHGIGICEGVQKLEGSGFTKDYVVVRYRDDDRLYVPIDQMDQLDRYTGAGAPAKLSKIGGVEFGRVKEKVKASVKKLAFDLLALYAERNKKKGFVYAKDTPLQIEFENSFEYTETEDQLLSLAEIKKDMEEGKVMERLLCGDVGFGKTEVALRAAFKAITNGKQVAFLAPTTILSEQHYNTARGRMDAFGANVQVLNRFKTPKQVKQILLDTESGKVDLLCGTHRLLSSDVHFKDLGLIILDEEQKFGVEDKEKIKLSYPAVDVLTLSATPIPRTLHMSLSGIRDVSIISTPPSERLPIATYVSEFSETLIKDAITKELSRGGQVFVLYNSVEKIYAFKERVQKIVPEARILVGHGQMRGRELEDVVYSFYHGEADVLICTTIIENGIDIENANTLIVCDCDKFGLSQLYQLRGRVGRGNRMAYAYFTYDKNKVLTEEAYKRLDAISEFTEFGSGFKLAMRDLEIRGSGNVLGAEQHGHLEKVGYELYSKLLAEAVSELKGDKKAEEKDVLMRVSLDAYIADSYITRSEDRMIAYKSIASIRSLEDKQKLEKNFADTFGEPPGETQNLIDIAYVKALAKHINAKEVVSNASSVAIIFDNKDDILGNEKIGDLIYKNRMICSLDFSKEPKIVFKAGKSAKENFDILKKFLS